jgi:hypothetical protein
VSEVRELRSTRDARTLVLAIDGGTITSDVSDDDGSTGDRHVLSIDNPAEWVLESMQRRSPSDSETALLVSRFTTP